MSGFKQRWVSTQFLKNQTAANSNPREFYTGPYTRQSQAAGCSMDQNGVLFMGLVASNTLACWNTRKPFTSTHLVPLMRDDRTMQFLTTVTVRAWEVFLLYTSKFCNFF